MVLFKKSTLKFIKNEKINSSITDNNEFISNKWIFLS